MELAAGSTAAISWLDAEGRELATGASPTIEFDLTEGEQGGTVVLKTHYPDVVTLNLGFNQSDDAGRYALDATYNKAPEDVVAVNGLTLLQGLRRFMAANSPLTGTLDFSGLSKLEFVECFKAQVEAVELRGCTSLIRLCLEENRLSTLDLNPVAASLKDLRAAVQQGGKLTFEPLRQPLTNLYHFCVRDQEVLGPPTVHQLPACEELWIWNTAQSGGVPVPPRVRSLAAAGNAYTSGTFTGAWTDGEEGELDLRDNKLSTIDLTGCRGLRTLRLDGNKLDRASVNALLAEVNSWRTRGGILSLSGSANATHSAKSGAAITALRKRGWEVTLADS